MDYLQFDGGRELVHPREGTAIWIGRECLYIIITIIIAIIIKTTTTIIIIITTKYLYNAIYIRIISSALQ